MIKTYDTIPSLPIGERSRREGIRTFRRDGFVILRDVVPDAILASLERGVESNMSSPSSWSNDYVSNNDDDDRRTVRQFAIDCRLPDENATSAFLHEHVLVKEGPGTTVMSTPWHQDEPYYGVDSNRLTDPPVPDVIAIRIVAGSHVEGRRYVPNRFVNGEPYASGAPPGYVPHT